MSSPRFAPACEAVRLRDGSVVHVRPMQPDDETSLRQMWPRLSPQTVYRRFMTMYPRGLPERTLHDLASVDHVQREALVAISWGKIVGVARYHVVADGEAEIAVLVEDAWQRRGLGRELTARLGALARERGIRTFSGTMLAENDAAFGLMRAVFGAVDGQISDGERTFRITVAHRSRLAG